MGGGVQFWDDQPWCRLSERHDERLSLQRHWIGEKQVGQRQPMVVYALHFRQLDRKSVV